MTGPADSAAEVERLEGERRTAMLEKDIAALQRLLHDDLVYVHSSGVRDSKESYIAGVASGVWDYRRVETSDQALKVHGSSVLVFGRLSMSIVSRGVPKEVASSTLAVWIGDGQAWRLVALHSAAFPAPEVQAP